MSSQTITGAAVGRADPPAVTFLTTEHFTLQGAGHSAVAGFATGGAVALAAVVTLMRVQNSAWRQIRQHPYFPCPRAAVPPAGSRQHRG